MVLECENKSVLFWWQGLFLALFGFRQKPVTWNKLEITLEGKSSDMHGLNNDLK